jgi:hypothetical protein
MARIAQCARLENGRSLRSHDESATACASVRPPMAENRGHHLPFLSGKVLTDDMLRVTIEGGDALAHPGPYRLKLFEEAANRYLRNAVIPARRIHSARRWFSLELGDPQMAHSTRRLSALYRRDGL